MEENFINFFLARARGKTRATARVASREEHASPKEIAEHGKILIKFFEPGKPHDGARKMNSKHEWHHFL